MRPMGTSNSVVNHYADRKSIPDRILPRFGGRYRVLLLRVAARPRPSSGLDIGKPAPAPDIPTVCRDPSAGARPLLGLVTGLAGSAP